MFISKTIGPFEPFFGKWSFLTDWGFGLPPAAFSIAGPYQLITTHFLERKMFLVSIALGLTFKKIIK